MNEDVIRSTKEHEVAIPEGSINAKSKSGMVNMTAIEPEHLEKTVHDKLVTNQRVAVDGESGLVASHMALPAQESHEANRAHLAGEGHRSHAVELVTDGIADPPPVQLPESVSDLQDPDLPNNLATDAEASNEAVDSPESLQVAHGNTDPQAQVVASLADKWQEDYAGRVVKLREEVELLNHRLDHLQK